MVFCIAFVVVYTLLVAMVVCTNKKNIDNDVQESIRYCPECSSEENISQPTVVINSGRAPILTCKKCGRKFKANEDY